MKANIERAHARDTTHILRLLEENELTTDGLLDHLATILVARLGDRIVGTAALEIHSDGALLRSVAVSSEFRGQGIGAALVQSAMQVAEEQSLRDVYLLTFTAEHYFVRLGFELLDRGDVPDAVRTSVQFTRACPSTALAMRRRLMPPAERRIKTKSDPSRGIDEGNNDGRTTDCLHLDARSIADSSGGPIDGSCPPFGTPGRAARRTAL
jgi:amino-acid N-acetyltransferase